MTDGANARRLFLGIALPETVRATVQSCAALLRQMGVMADNWSAPDLYHITVLFLGQTSETESGMMDPPIREVLKTVAPFSLTLTDVGGFRRNKVLWIGVEDNEGKRALTSLHDVVRGVVQRTAPSVYSRLDDRPFSPHLTIARKVRMDSFVPRAITGDTLSLAQPAIHTPFDVTDLCLFESTRRDGRLCYPVVERYPFAPNPSKHAMK